jgi:hypothetical protein
MSYGYKAVLSLDGENDIILDNCSYTYVRELNEKTAEVQSKVLNGTIYVVFTDHPTNNIWEWSMRYKFKNGKIKLMQIDSDKGTYVSVEELSFDEASCIGLKLNYSRAGGGHFCTQLTISSNNSVLGDTYDWVNKEWLLQ